MNQRARFQRQEALSCRSVHSAGSSQDRCHLKVTVPTWATVGGTRPAGRIHALEKAGMIHSRSQGEKVTSFIEAETPPMSFPFFTELLSSHQMVSLPSFRVPPKTLAQRGQP